MSNADVAVGEKPPANSRSVLLAGLIVSGAIALAVVLSIAPLGPPKAVPASAASGEFSSERATRHLASIARTPHPIGSAAHDEVRDYIVGALSGIGLTPEVQKAEVVDAGAVPISAATVENIIARLKGSSGGKAVLLVSHYDSTPLSPGASDDGSGVATLLETARALAAGPPLKKDVVFLFTDGEEAGLLGARAFVNDPRAKDAGVVLNFEARGSRGPAIMFETSADNAWLIDGLAGACPYPLANSLTDEIYKRLPNDTDLTVFKKAGLSGLNFAFIDGYSEYHSSRDDLEHLDQGSIQHQGSYALTLARHFGNLDAESISKGSAVYFNLWGPLFIHYSAKWSMAFALFTALVFVAIAGYCLRTKILRARQIVIGTLAFLGVLTVTALAVQAVSWILRALNIGYKLNPQREPYNGPLFMLLLICVAGCICLGLYLWLRKRIGAESLALGAVTFWLVLEIAAVLFLTGASYITTWPLLVGLAGVIISLRGRASGEGSLIDAGALSIFAAPIILLTAPMMYLIWVSIGIASAPAIAAMLAAMMGLLFPQLDVVTRQTRSGRRNLLPAAVALLTLLFFVPGAVGRHDGGSQPAADHVFYAMNGDTQKAVWASLDAGSDSWTRQFFSSGARKGPIEGYITSQYPGFVSAEAPAISVQPPELSVVSDVTAAGSRTVKLRLRSLRKASLIQIAADPSVRVLSASINGARVTGGETSSSAPKVRWGLLYYAPPPEGIYLTLEIDPSRALKLVLSDQSYGLPQIPGMALTPRPDSLVPAPIPYSDSLLVTRSFSF